MKKSNVRKMRNTLFAAAALLPLTANAEVISLSRSFSALNPASYSAASGFTLESSILPTAADPTNVTTNTSAGYGGTAYTSSNGSTLTLTGDSGAQTGALTGNLQVILDITGGNGNGNRVEMTGTNTFSGGLTVKNGTLRFQAVDRIGTGTITVANATLMGGKDGAKEFNVTNNMVLDGFGALRASGSGWTASGQISGNGDLLIHTEDTSRPVTLTNTNNNYTGITNIGGYAVPSSNNPRAALILGANEVLPNSTVVQIGVNYGTPNGNVKLAESLLNLNGKTETIAGLEGKGKLNASADGSVLNIVAAADHTFEGTVNPSKIITLNVSGTNAQNFTGQIENLALGVSGTASSDISAANILNLAGLSVGENASVTMASNSTTAITGDINLYGALNGANLTLNQTGTGVISIAPQTAADFSHVTIDVNKGTFKYSDTNAVMNYTEDSTIDLNGQQLTFETLSVPKYTNSSTDAATLTFGNSTADETYTNTITRPAGNLNLTKVGTNTVTFTNTIQASVLNIQEGKIAMTPETVLKLIELTGTGTVDLNGGELETHQLKIATTNTNTEDLSTITIVGSANKTLAKITGNTRLKLSMNSNQENANRVYLTAGSQFEGGVEIYKGTLRVDDLNMFAANPKMTGTDGKERIQVDFSGGSLMSNKSWGDDYVFNILNDRAAIRATGTNFTMNLGALITGNGSLEIVNDQPITLSNTKNDYTGDTYIGFLSYRSDGKNAGGTLYLGNDEVIPDTSTIIIGTGEVHAALKLNLNGKTETVAGLEGGISTKVSGETREQVTNGYVSGSGTLILNDSENHTYMGYIQNSVNIEKTGSAVWTYTGQSTSTGMMEAKNGTIKLNSSATVPTVKASGTGTIQINENSTVTNASAVDGGIVNISSAVAVPNVTAANGGIVGIGETASVTTADIQAGGTVTNVLGGSLSTANLSGGTLIVDTVSQTQTAMNAVSGDSTIRLVPQLGFYQQKFESPDQKKLDSYYRYAGDLTEDKNHITNMDQWVNKERALQTQTSTAIWGELVDKSVTNVFQTAVTNTKNEDVTIDVGKYFRNDATVTITDAETGEEIAKLEWTKLDGYADNSSGITEGITLEAGKTYLFDVRASRFNQTIGTSHATGSSTQGLNNSVNHLVGIGVRQQGTTEWYGMNVLDSSAEWGWKGSGLYAVTGDSQNMEFAPNLNIAEGASATLEVYPNSNTNITKAPTGTGTLGVSSMENAPANVNLAVNTPGNVAINRGVNFTANDGVVIAGNLVLNEGAVLVLDDPTKQMTANTITGRGTVRIDLDKIQNAQTEALIVLSATDPESLGMEELVFELASENLGDLIGSDFILFESEVLTVEALTDILFEEGSDWTVWEDGENQFHISLESLSVPEPSTWALLVLGSGLLCTFRKRGRKQTAA